MVAAQRKDFWTRGAALRLALVVTAAMCAITAGGEEFDGKEELRVFRQRHGALRKKLKAERDALTAEVRLREKRGEAVRCAKQILQEAGWLLSYTAEYERAEKRLGELRRRLESGEVEGVEQAEDGSYGACCEEWFMRLDATVGRLIVMKALGQRPERPLRFLERINSPERLEDYFDSILISDVAATGRDHRKELNFSVAALVRLIPGVVESGFAFHPELEEALWRYLDEKWQDPETGYWGAWYKKNGKVIKTADLSITFHIVSYRGGRVGRWPEIVATTLAMREREYPYGWREEGRPSNHHHYDVVTLLRYGWPYMTAEQRAESAARIEEMLRWCLEETLLEDGTFRGDGEDGTPEAFYFGVSLLEEMGYFDARRRYWTERAFPEAEALRRRLVLTALTLNMADEHTLFALGKLTGRANAR